MDDFEAVGDEDMYGIERSNEKDMGDFQNSDEEERADFEDSEDQKWRLKSWQLQSNPKPFYALPRWSP